MTEDFANKPACGLCCTILDDFGVKYQSHTALENINLHIHCGELTAIIGPNGAGKSTLLKAILGEVEHSGHLSYLDADNRKADHPVIGYVPQKLDFDLTTPITVRDFFCAVQGRRPVWTGASSAHGRRALDMLSRVEAAHLYKRKLGELSGGELQRVLLALALEPVPDLLLLDEPVTGIDQQGMKLFYHMLDDFRRAYDLSIIVISHELDLVAQYADRVVLLNKRILANGKVSEVYSHPAFLSHFGRVPFELPPAYQIIEEA